MVGRFLVAQHEGVYLLKLTGDVRVTLCTAVDEFLERMFDDPTFKSVVVDLTETTGIDSTSLGILAKLSIQADRRFHFRPTLISTQPDINRQLGVMGFDEVYNIIHEPLTDAGQLSEVPKVDAPVHDVRARVLEAHRILMAMNENNRHAFQDLVTALEADPVGDDAGPRGPGGSVARSA